MLIKPCVMGDNGMSYKKPPLSDSEIENVRPVDKSIKLFDGGGFSLHIDLNASKLQRFKYRFGGKEKLISLSAYPDVYFPDVRFQGKEHDHCSPRNGLEG
jgi:hypothetical protein